MLLEQVTDGSKSWDVIGRMVGKSPTQCYKKACAMGLEKRPAIKQPLPPDVMLEPWKAELVHKNGQAVNYE